jgi:preprotein translocase subunit YajC
MILLQASSAALIQQLVMLGLIVVVFYFFMIRPQQKRSKEQKQFKEGIKRGDTVVTIGGMHGKVFQVNDETIVLEVDKGIQLTIEKSAISLESTMRLQGKTK